MRVHPPKDEKTTQLEDQPHTRDRSGSPASGHALRREDEAQHGAAVHNAPSEHIEKHVDSDDATKGREEDEDSENHEGELPIMPGSFDMSMPQQAGMINRGLRDGAGHEESSWSHLFSKLRMSR